MNRLITEALTLYRGVNHRRNFGVAALVNLGLLASCNTPAQAPGIIETPRVLQSAMEEQLKAGILLKNYPTTDDNNKYNSEIIREWSGQHGDFLGSFATVGFNPNDSENQPITSEIFAFKNGVYTIFYNEKGQRASELMPFSYKYGTDSVTGNLTMEYVVTQTTQSGEKIETPYLAYYSNTPVNNIQDLYDRAKNGDKEAIASLIEFFDSSSKIDEVVYNNLATKQGIHLVKKDNPNWLQQIGEFFSDDSNFKVIGAKAKPLSPAELTAQALTPLPTETPLPPATAILTPTESPSRNALLALGYPYDELKDYTISEGDWSFPGDTVIYHDSLIGTKADGSKEMLAIKFSDNPNYLKLSSTEIMELANKACSAGACFFQSALGDEREPITHINGVTTGIILSDDKKDETGNIIASSQSVLMLTLDDSGHPRFVKMVVQVEDPANPNENLLKNDILNVLGLITESSTKVSSQQELAGFFQKGRQIEFGVQQIEFIGGGKVNGWSFFKNTFGADPMYQSALQLFLLKNGLLQAGNDSILVLLTTTDN